MTQILIAMMLLSALAAAEPATAPTTTPSTQPSPVVAIFREPGYPPPGVTPHWDLSIGIWDDGTVVYASAKEDAPYHSAKVDPARIDKLIADLDAAGLFDDAEVNRQPYRVPPDAGATVLAVEWKGKRQRLGHWRELPDDRFGQVWKASEKLIRELRPDGGEPVQEIDKRIFRIGWKKK